eukprot:CAMPEP_0206139172 /NCGR_PEP_ID=MMETSP1473-20131121/4887_1 /ASSEMBLY_ACC=CAM_ASM_001109 /TAXON_ID=1461547 /ORGANISM="Stichococcus sp, Strain RCC1054" /LENGTH=223 /DNA_ID=CAMNT_0053532835 /DNA_START=215 /DNA_END=886 /DNA_ORIENTATION=-
MATKALLDESDFQTMGQDMARYDELRESVIKQSRDVGKLAKQAIFSLHRSDFKGASDKLEKAEKFAAAIRDDILAEEPNLRHGSFSAAMEEYAEAILFRGYLLDGRLLPSTSLPTCNREEYLGGVLDFTGELNRFAVAKATVRDTNAVQDCKDLTEGIFGQFLQYDMRNGAIRKKFDSLKYTLRKMETLLYELSLAKSGTPVRSDGRSDLQETEDPQTHNADD